MTSERPPVRRRRTGAGPAVAARFADLGEARVAITALAHAGLDGNDIELLGRSVEAARLPHNPKLADRRMVFYLLPRLVRGLAVGVGCGTLVGAIIAALLLGTGAMPGSIGSLAVCLLVGSFPGGTVGVLIAFERSISLADDWSLTFEDAPAGPVWVGVYTGDPHERARALRVLEQRRPLELRAS